MDALTRQAAAEERVSSFAIRRRIWLIFAVLVVYTLFGGAVFSVLETPQENIKRAEWHSLMLRIQNATTTQDYMALREFTEPLQWSSTNNNWDFLGGVFFSLSILTTIGYGNFAPSTVEAQVFLLFYATMGLLAVGYALSAMAESIVIQIAKLVAKMRREGSHKHLQLDETGKLAHKHRCHALQISATLTLLLLFIGAGLFSLTEDWTYFESVYFCFLTLTTIGLGDFAPTSTAGLSLSLVYILLGLCTLGFLLNAVGEWLHERISHGVRKSTWRAQSVQLKDVLVKDQEYKSDEADSTSVSVDPVLELSPP